MSDISVVKNEIMWSMKYRPQKLSEVILPDDLKSEFENMVKKKELIHTLFSGRPGVGKTTIAKAIINEIEADYLFLNGSAERGIDTIRNKITNYCQALSLESDRKVVLFDEADQLTVDAQLALRAVMETFASNVTFFLTANFPDRIDDALKSRCQEVRFDPEKNKADIMKKMAMRCVAVLKNENVEFDKNAIMAIVKAKFPDMRSVMNSLQQFSSKGKIDESVAERVKTTSVDALFEILRAKKFKDMHRWVLENVTDPSQFVNELWYLGEKKVEKSSLAYYAVFLDDCQDRMTRVPDRLLTLVATLTKVMADCSFVKED